MNTYTCGNAACVGDSVLVMNSSHLQRVRPSFLIGQTLDVLKINSNGNVCIDISDVFWNAKRFKLVCRKKVRPVMRVVKD